MSDERLLEVAQAAHRWNVLPETIRRWIRGGKMRAVKTPGKRGVWRIPADALPQPGSTHVPDYAKKA
jgi:excisionase family DNA binding protein